MGPFGRQEGRNLEEREKGDEKCARWMLLYLVHLFFFFFISFSNFLFNNILLIDFLLIDNL